MVIRGEGGVHIYTIMAKVHILPSFQCNQIECVRGRTDGTDVDGSGGTRRTRRMNVVDRGRTWMDVDGKDGRGRTTTEDAREEAEMLGDSSLSTLRSSVKFNVDGEE